MDATPPVTPNLIRPAEMPAPALRWPRRHVPGAARVGRNTIETLVFRGLSTPVALLLVVLQSRLLDPAGRGTFVLAVLSVTILSRLLGQLGAAVASRMAEEGADVRALLHRAFGIAVVAGAVGTGLVVGWGAVSSEIGFDVAALAAIALVPNVLWQTVSGVLLGLARVRVWNYIQALPPILSLAGLLIAVVALDLGVEGAVGAWAAAHIATAIFALAVSYSLWSPFAVPRLLDRHGRTIFRLALLMGAVQLVNLVSYRVELLVLGALEGVDDVGVYSIAMQAAEGIWLVPAAVATAITGPAVHETREAAARLVARAARRGLLLGGAVAAVVGVAGPLLVPLLFGDDFSGATRPLALLLPGVVVYGPVTILVVFLSVRCGRPRLSLAVSALAGTVTVGLSVLLIPAYGASGAALASTIGYASGALLAWVFFTRLAGLSVLGRRRG